MDTAALLESAEDSAFGRMKPVNAIVSDILKHRDAMVALSKYHGTNPVDVICLIENLSEWAGAIERAIRSEEFQGSIEWWR